MSSRGNVAAGGVAAAVGARQVPAGIATVLGFVALIAAIIGLITAWTTALTVVVAASIGLC